MSNDPISDMLARIRNAAMVRLDRTEMPHSKIKVAIAEILKSEGFISDFREEKEHPAKLTVYLKYGRDRESAIAGIRRTSRPGRRLYVGYQSIPKVLNGLGVSIVSTSQGVMTDTAARDSKVGGEILCEVW